MPMPSEDYPSIDDALADLELAVARRADQLAQSGLCSTPLNLHCWLQAEQEILGRTPAATRRAPVEAPSDVPAGV